MIKDWYTQSAYFYIIAMKHWKNFKCNKNSIKNKKYTDSVYKNYNLKTTKKLDKSSYRRNK
jgi:hypothetical protein